MDKEKRDHRIARYGGLSNQGFRETPDRNLYEVPYSHTIKFKGKHYDFALYSAASWRASKPSSPVRTFTTFSTSYTKILPSP